VNCTLEQAMKTQTRSKGIAPLFLYPRERDAVPIVREAGWAPGPVWTGAENLAPTGIRSSDHTAVASRYTGWAVPAHFNKLLLQLFRHQE